jgi:RES domain-containing protein
VIPAWRVVRAEYAAPPYNPFDGKGSFRVGGRWNSPGIAVVYTFGSIALALLEILVHADSLASIAGHVVFSLSIPEELVTHVDEGELLTHWQAPHAPAFLQEIGDRWVAIGTSAVLRVPSAVVSTEYNYVLNPAHPDFGRIVRGTKQPLPIDSRLLKK